jgi:PadR family transcriptional regulator, regulatory protein AphA
MNAVTILQERTPIAMDVKTLCLGVLTERDMTGYEIKQHFEQAFSHFFGAGYGSIYPAMAELTRRGLVTCTSVEQEKRPDKKVYSLTAAGRRLLVEELMETPPRHKVRSEFLVLMYFAHLLPPARLAAIFDERMAEWEAQLAAVGACIEAMEAEGGRVPPGVTFAAGYGRAVIAAARDYVALHKGELLRAVADAPAPADVAAE